MKEFLSKEKFNKTLFISVGSIFFILYMIISINNIIIHYFDYRALLITLLIWGLSSLLDKKTYFNLATLIGPGLFMYMIWFIIFNYVYTL